MNTIHRSVTLASYVAALAWFPGCADPCVDDGLLQDPGSNCPAETSGGTDGTGTAGTDGTATGDETGTGTVGGPACDDGVRNGDETDVDCGGSCGATCETGELCGDGGDCVSGECGDDMRCVDMPTCDDGIQNGDETDVDCGGSCSPCPDGDSCVGASDCESGLCREDTCVPPACDDGEQNGDETDVDCGGPDCDPCDDGESCVEDTDCMSMSCPAGTCGDACENGLLDGAETDVDCGGPTCAPCPDGDDCTMNLDCLSVVCDPGTSTCSTPTCDDGVTNGDETDLDCGGSCGPTCDPGDTCTDRSDCISRGCDAGTCRDLLSVSAAPACSSFSGTPVTLSATASGGSGNYTFAWAPDDGSLTDPAAAMTDASPSGFQSYTVTVDDGFVTAQDSVVVVDANPFDLENNCTLYQADYDISQSGFPAQIAYDMMGTRACEVGNNEFGLHLCEGVTFRNTRLRGVLQVTADPEQDNDWMGLVWGAQDSSHFYSLTWKQSDQMDFACPTPGGIVVRRIEGPDFASLEVGDFYCEADTPNSTLLLGPADTTTEGWALGESYSVTIDFTDAGSMVSVVRDSDSAVITTFMVADTTYTSGFFGSTTASQQGACAGPLFAECL